MKKQYTAPEIFFEDFTLSQSIAGGCEVISNNHSANSCGIDWGRFVVFNADLGNVCDRTPADTGGKYDGLCYHVPTDANNLFNS